MKAAVIFYHNNAFAIYQKRWIEKCISSIALQTMQDYDVIELCYGKDEEHLCKIPGHYHIFLHKPMDNHIEAMNYILDCAFNELHYDVVFNTNMDDYYDTNRFALQSEEINKGYDIVSGGWTYIHERNCDGLSIDIPGHKFDFHDRDVFRELSTEHNVIAHPAVAFSSKFWRSGLRYNTTMLGYEDLDLWKRAIIAGHVFKIIRQNVLFYRIHDRQVTQVYDGKGNIK